MTKGRPETLAATTTGDLFAPVGDGFVVLQAVAGETLVIPNGAMLLAADFVRQGADLMLVGPDGGRVLIKGYFDLVDPPALATAAGAVLPPELVAKLAGPLAPGQYAQLAPEAGAAPIGSVLTLEGTVTATRADGTVVELAPGSPVFQNDVIATGPDGAVGLVFNDDTTFSLGAEARMVLDEMIYDPATGSGSMSFSVLQGVFVFVTGEIAGSGPDAMVVKTPVATIGIRGTKVVGQAAQEGEINTVTLLEDDDGTVGTIIVSTPIGQIILDASNYQNNAVFISSAGAAPTILSFTPLQFENLFGPGDPAAPGRPARTPAPPAGRGRRGLARRRGRGRGGHRAGRGGPKRRGD